MCNDVKMKSRNCTCNGVTDVTGLPVCCVENIVNIVTSNCYSRGGAEIDECFQYFRVYFFDIDITFPALTKTENFWRLN